MDRDNSIVYIGISGSSTLKKRLLQELRAKGHGTFFRSLGAILGYLPPKGSLRNKKNKQNYKFSNTDETSIISWINNHIQVSWLEISQGLATIEIGLIMLYKPFLNIDNNPQALQILKNLRRKCRENALAE